MNDMKPEIENLKNRVFMKELTKHQKGLAIDELKSLLNYVHELEQRLNLSGIGSKRPTDYEIDKIVTEIWNDAAHQKDEGRNYIEKIRTLFQAACASGGEGKGVVCGEPCEELRSACDKCYNEYKAWERQKRA